MSKQAMQQALKCIKDHVKMDITNVEHIGLTVSRLREAIKSCDDNNALVSEEEILKLAESVGATISTADIIKYEDNEFVKQKRTNLISFDDNDLIEFVNKILGNYNE